MIPASYLEFLALIGVAPLPGQRVLCKVAFDGWDPCDLDDPEERELARQMFGDVETIPDAARHVFVGVCGGRAGKTYLLGALRALHLALTVPLTTMAPGEVAMVPLVAPEKDLAVQLFNYVNGAIDASVVLGALRNGKPKAMTIPMVRPDGAPVEIEVKAASRGGTTVRGRTLPCGVLDECAFFRDAETGVVNDEDVYKGMAPRVVRGGQVLIISTPWLETGLLWEFFSRNHGHPVDAIAARAPTLLLRDVPDTRAYVERERVRDPQNAEREFDAQFMGSSATAFFDPVALRKATYEGDYSAPAHASPAVGGDFGFDRDCSALAIAWRDGATIAVDSKLHELKPTRAEPLKPSEVCRSFAEATRGAGAEYVVADHHYRRSIEEHLNSEGLTLVMGPEGIDGKVESYQLVRALLREGRLRLPNSERLLRQLREVVARKTAGGRVTISAPRWKGGGHGDLVSAVVLAVWDAERGALTVAETPAESPEAAEAARWVTEHEEREVEYARQLAEDAIWG